MKRGDKGCLWAVAVLATFLVLLSLPSAIPTAQYRANPKSLFMIGAIGLISVGLITAVLLVQAKASSAEPQSEPDVPTQETMALQRALMSGLLIFISLGVYIVGSKMTNYALEYFLIAFGMGAGLLSLWICISNAIEVLILRWRSRR